MLNKIPQLQRYGIAIASVAIALILMLALDPFLYLYQASFLLFFGAITITALYGGRSAGIVATLLAALFANYFFLAPQYAWTLDLASSLRMAIFIVQGVLISVLVGSLRAAQIQIRKNLTQIKASESAIKDLNKTLQRRVEELQTLFDVIPINIVVAEDPDCRVVRANPAYSKRLQIPPDTNVSVAFPDNQVQLYRFYQNGQEVIGDDLPVEHAAKHGVEVRDIEIDLVQQDNTVINLYGHAVPLFDETGQPRGSIGVFTDITELKRVETALRDSEEQLKSANQRFHLAAQAVNCLIYEWDLTCDRVERTDGLTRILGYSLEEAEPTGQWWADRVHPDDLPIVREYAWSVLATDDHCSTEYRVLNKANQYIDMLDQCLVVARDAEGKPTRIVGSTTDISDRKQAEAERQQLLERERTVREEAERANRVKDEFLSILSHELRSPLNPILGWARLLQAKQFNEATTSQALATIERNARLQTQLIDDLLDVAKILRGKLSLNEAPVNLVGAIEAALEVVRTAAEAKAIQLVPDLTDIGLVLGDSARLQQVVWNLLSNAVKFTPNGGRVEVRLERVSDQAQISVTDTGKGINPQFLPHIFESFRQEDVSITRRYGGLGLGLSIVKYLIDAHGGTITADSPGEDQGATFTIQLPLLHEDTAPSTTARFSPAQIDLTGINVLAVDDSEDARDLLAMLLTQYGAEARVVATGKELLALLNRIEPHVLVCDIGMPEMDGYLLLQQIRALPADQGGNIPAIALTAYAKEEDYQRAIDHGFQRHIAKPVDPELLAIAIAELAKNR